jgi:6-phosphogluconolactonase/glucosamine-6-phosphate isomerase/deaminase
LLHECAEYERKIQSVGGIDIFLGGMGEDGHLAFNEVKMSFPTYYLISRRLTCFVSFSSSPARPWFHALASRRWPTIPS